MSLFYQNPIKANTNILSEEESRHCAQVLRHTVGDEIVVLDGEGGKYYSVLTKVSKNACEFEVQATEQATKKDFSIHLAIAPTKNTDRIEWMIEKLSEIGVDQVTFLETQHSERRKIRMDRLEKKALSAMKQSKNPYKLQLNPILPFKEFVQVNQASEKLIAHVDPAHPYLAQKIQKSSDVSILIGPEGDFSSEELEWAQQTGYQTASLGNHTLRTETAGFVACCMVNIVNLS